MKLADIENYYSIYKDGLLEDTIPFWTKHSVDNEHGGFMFCLDRDGTVMDSDKAVWTHCRFIWLLSTLYNTVQSNPQWLKTAAHGVEFAEKHFFDSDGRMFFQVTREGKGLRKRRYLFSEFFAVLGYSAYAKASGCEKAAERAKDIFELIIRYLNSPGLLEPKLITDTRNYIGLSIPMMIICACQEMKKLFCDNSYDKYIDQAIETIATKHLNHEYKCVLENVTPEGNFVDHYDGRLVTPGHGIEAGWFIMHEAVLRNKDPELIRLGCQILDYCWQIGWDKEYGGIIYFRDAKGLTPTEYWHDMKFWWQQNETIIATLLAHYLTGDEKYAKWHKQIHDWAYERFPDPEYGEWFGYLHRDGRISSKIKGNMWKGPFHLPRMQWYCSQLLVKMKNEHQKKLPLV